MGKPASYASFLGIELSLAYSQRLLVVMPDGFGFNWQGHSTGAAYRVLGKVDVKPGGTGLATSAVTAVRALAAASGVRLAAPAIGRAAGQPHVGTAAGDGSRPGAAVRRPAGCHRTAIGHADSAHRGHRGRRSDRVRAGRLARPAGLQLPVVPGSRTGVEALGRSEAPRAAEPDGSADPAGPRLGIPGTWLAAGFVAIAVTLIALHTVLTPTAGVAQASAATEAGLTSNPNLDPGTSLSQVAPDFTLTDQFGQPVSLSSYRGKVVILTFNDSECTSVCPLTTAALVDAKTMLGAAASQVQLIGINANPRETSIEDVLSYSQLHGMLYQWRYLTGSLPQLQAVWKDYSIGVTVNENQIDHEPAVFVINQQGRLAKLYLTQLAYSAVPQLGQLLANEVSSLLPSHPAVHSHLSYDEVAAIGPAAASTVPAANGGGYVSLGPGQPGEQDQARGCTCSSRPGTRRSPASAASSTRSTRTSRPRPPPACPASPRSTRAASSRRPSALPNFLAALTHPLSYPVGIDGSGQVADGYGVQGEPWFVLASPSGKAIWTWEVSTSGWLSTASLDRHMRAALASAAKGRRRRPVARAPAPQEAKQSRTSPRGTHMPTLNRLRRPSGALRPDCRGRLAALLRRAAPARPRPARRREAEPVAPARWQLRQHAPAWTMPACPTGAAAAAPRRRRRPAGSTRAHPGPRHGRLAGDEDHRRGDDRRCRS